MGIGAKRVSVVTERERAGWGLGRGRDFRLFPGKGERSARQVEGSAFESMTG